MNLVLLNSKADLKWLRDVHLKESTTGKLPRYRSAILYGNEDCPEKIAIYANKQISISDSPLRVLFAGQNF